MKWRFYRSLIGGNDRDAERVYRWHIGQRSGARMALGLNTDSWKRSIDDYVQSATDLYRSVQRVGFLHAVPLDANGELLNGSHRVALARALEHETMPVQFENRLAWAPPWNEAWFVEHGVASQDLERIRADWELMQR